MKQVQQLMLNERNNLPNPDPFYICFTGGAGVGKSFLVKCLTEYMQKNLKFPKQNFSEEQSLGVTASIGLAATNVNGTTLHSAFRLPVKQPGMGVREKPSDEHLQGLQRSYEFLKSALIDEISMSDNLMFDSLNRWLRAIKRRDAIDFVALSVYVLTVCDFFQLPTVHFQKYDTNSCLAQSCNAGTGRYCPLSW